MRKPVAVISTVFMLALLLAAAAAPAAGQPGPAPQLRLDAGTFAPAAGDQLDLPAGLTVASYARGQRGYYVVQFSGPVQAQWKAAAEAAGAELLDYLPDYAFKARMNPAQAARVERLADVAWVGIFQPAFKLSPRLDTVGFNAYRVRIEDGVDVAAAAAAISATGAQVIGADGTQLTIAADGSALPAVANVLDVAWVENFDFHEKHNEYGAGAILGATTANASGYDGSTQIAAVADTGIGDGTASGAHADIPAGRVTAIQNFTTGNSPFCYNVFPDGARDVDSGHGTHVALSVLGDGGPFGEAKGTAPAANLVFQAIEEYIDTFGACAGSPDGYYLVGIPDDLHQLYQPAYNAGARVHSNSWGSDAAGDYTLDSANTDDFIWDNPDMTITFSAGNDGTDANSDGVIDDDSIGSPATAKNVITVGASENDRAGNYDCDTGLGYVSQDAYQSGQTCASMSGQNLLGTWGSRYGFVGPMANDPTAGNQEQMAGWSSRGPTDDGRIKPDVVGPGTWVLSGYSGLHQEGYGDPVNPQNGVYQWDGWGMPASADHKYMGGTSMSNPIVAGGATVVRDFYQKTDAHAASAALIKATLINSAVDLADENNDGADDNDFPIPNVHEGWGRVDLANATDGSHVYVDDGTGVGTGGSATHQYSVAAGGSPFKVSLVWSDFPSTEAAAVNLVNDLDLVVTAPGGATYRGNVFSGGWSQTGGSADATNNVENVYVQSAAAGTWTVRVDGANVPQGPQPFALVVDGVFGPPPDLPPTVTLTNPAEGATVSATISVTANASDDNGVTQVEFFVGAVSIGTDTTAPYSASWDTTTVVDGAHTVTATATDTAAQTASDTNNVTVANTVPTTMHVGDLDSYANSQGKNWQATVEIAVHDAAENAVSGATVSGTWGGGASGTGLCVTGAGGTCQVTSANIPKKQGTATFTVTSVTHGSLSYAAGDNHDPDGDSNGTTITASKDDPGAPPPPPPPPPPPGSEAHVGDLDGSSSAGKGNKWNASVVVTVHDAGEAPVSGASVSGTWSNGASGGGSCTTDGSGQCTIGKNNIRNSAQATFTVDSVAASGFTYVATDNHDPDGDSDGTSITVAAP